MPETEIARLDVLQWQVAGASKTAHIIDPEVTAPKKSGARSLCGRYPQRNDFPWFALDVATLGLTSPPLPYALRRCGDCLDVVTSPGATP